MISCDFIYHEGRVQSGLEWRKTGKTLSPCGLEPIGTKRPIGESLKQSAYRHGEPVGKESRERNGVSTDREPQREGKKKGGKKKNKQPWKHTQKQAQAAHTQQTQAGHTRGGEQQARAEGVRAKSDC